MKRLKIRSVAVIAASAIVFTVAGSHFKGNAENNKQHLRGRVVAVGIAGASAISPVGSFLPGGPIHDNPVFAAYTLPGRVLDPSRILVGNQSNFGAPLANADQQEGSFLSIDPGGDETLVIPPLFATGGGPGRSSN